MTRCKREPLHDQKTTGNIISIRSETKNARPEHHQYARAPRLINAALALAKYTACYWSTIVEWSKLYHLELAAQRVYCGWLEGGAAANHHFQCAAHHFLRRFKYNRSQRSVCELV